MRLDKFLADMGAGSRREVAADIRAGLVQAGTETVRRPEWQVREDETVLWRGLTVRYRAKEYFMLHKPAGILTATSDRHQETVLDCMIPENCAGEKLAFLRRDLFPVGRLDRDTEGLLLMTNDGELAHRLLSPKHQVDKVYEARLERPVGAEDARRFAEGLRVDETLTAMPAVLEILEDRHVLVTVREGKFHQVKRMFEAVGNRVLYLKRLSMGTLRLDSALAPGTFRRLTDEELAALEQAGGREPAGQV